MTGRGSPQVPCVVRLGRKFGGRIAFFPSLLRREEVTRIACVALSVYDVELSSFRELAVLFAPSIPSPVSRLFPFT